MARSSRMFRTGWGFVIGGAVTALSCAGLAGGIWNGLDHFGLDLHFRYANAIPADPAVVLVDINDHALRAVGDWPWPRRRYAQIVSMLHELGARTTVLDIILADRTAPRLDDGELRRRADVDAFPESPSAFDVEHWIDDDEEFAQAASHAGNVYLAMFAPLSPPGTNPDVLWSDAVAALAADPGMTSDRFIAWASTRGTASEAAKSMYLPALMMAVLQADFALDLPAVHERVAVLAGATLREVETHLPFAKRWVARQKAREFLNARPESPFAASVESTAGSPAPDDGTADGRDLRDGFRYELARRALSGRSGLAGNSFEGVIPNAHDATLPFHRFAAAVKGIGFVSFNREESRGVVRAVPLLVQVHDTTVTQLGFLAALAYLGVDPASLALANGALVVRDGKSRLAIPLEAGGEALINWHVPAERDRWQDSFDHIPVTRLLEVAMNREALAETEQRHRLGMADLVRLRHADTPAEFNEYARALTLWAAASKRRAQPSGSQDAAAVAMLDARLADLDRSLGPFEEDALVWLQRARELWVSTEPTNDAERAEKDRIDHLYAEFVEGRLASRIQQDRGELLARNDSLIAELRPRVHGKICLVGYTASGVADLVTTPVYSSMPGVMAHANLVNMVLQNRVPSRAPRWFNFLLFAASGLAISWAAASRRLGYSVVTLLVIVLANSLLGIVAFRTGTVHVASLAATVHTFLAWAVVTAYRQGTEERARRRFQHALAQYTSPVVAVRIAASASTRDLQPRPACVTCFFSDLYDFTELSERLGPERTRRLLNPYLEAMSEVLVSHRAVVNKFMGDGIFAFFNAPIWPCESPAAAACSSAMASLAALEDLNRRRGGPETWRPILRMRVGISTGEVFVGDYGSEAKLDYTCIGDTVNLGARLEAANKSLGTTVLVDRATREGAGDRFAFRSLGLVELPGRSRAVDAFELLGLSAGLNGRDREFASRFAEAVRFYQSCEWDSCARVLGECRGLRPDDDSVARYEEAVSQYRRQGRPVGWTGGLVVPHK